jgi:arsenate reductase-like glutaredoxin family protein
MDYLLFTYPNCQKCVDLKVYLKNAGIPACEYKVEEKPGRLKIREFLGSIKRDAKGAIILPALVCRDNGAVAAVVNTSQELEEWLRSRG